ncbi:hypothetical protein HB852_10990 [Listeria grandensis]|uniref:hypothetical protein n=1 Tax=Listeria grandensis TaxID=1494963 RepID=UPI00162A39BB|nr:hypothetical protein [Listeria grandensis]MBC1475143.1 hypothetical protein [Listeria grandensis]
MSINKIARYSGFCAVSIVDPMACAKNNYAVQEGTSTLQKETEVAMLRSRPSS